MTPDIKGYRLYVTQGASQIRRRIKGMGFGVRKVESAGRNQAVIIHTATGEHLRQLRVLLADVIATSPPDQEPESAGADSADD